MATCIYCGAQIADGAKFCTNCGSALPVEVPLEQTIADANVQQPYQQPVAQQPAAHQPGTFNPDAAQPYQQQGSQQPTPPQSYQQPAYQQPAYQQPYAQAQPAVSDSGSIGWGVLGFFFPIVGLVLFLVWRTTKPKCAKVAGIGAIIGFCLGLVANFSMFMN